MSASADVTTAGREVTGLPGGTLRFIQPQRVLYWRTVGPYRDSSRQAWARAFTWLDRMCGHETPGMGFGLAHDDPRTIAAEHLRYDACILPPQGFTAHDWAAVETGFLAGGAHLVVSHKGDYSALGPEVAALRDSDHARKGVARDAGRPVMVLYLDDPRRVAAPEQRCDICLPVIVERRATARD